ncbi:GHKL domain-containing protein [candidate division KSB1 bacterium]|nr:GHKL domain-containing protein [candidate division KSB1 bacterium]
MAFNFRINVIWRVLLLCGMFYGLIHLVFKTELYATMVVGGIAIVYQIYSLIRYVEMTNRKLTTFLQSIKYSDFSQSFDLEHLGSSFKELSHSFSEVIKSFQKARSEREEQFRYLQTVVQHIGIGLIIIKSDGTVDMINNAAKKLLGIVQLQQIGQLDKITDRLAKRITDLNRGSKLILKIHRDEQLLNFLIFVTDFIIGSEKYRLVTIQNIQSELEEKEMEAWQNLIRILTHEIMNSVTPIVSLSGTANAILGSEILANCDKMGACREQLDDITAAVATIENRSKGLLAFVENYRKLTRIPKPDYTIFPAQEIFDRVVSLFGAQLKDKNIKLSMDVTPPRLDLTADSTLLEQVLINLLKNAIEAVEGIESPRIAMKAFLSPVGRPVIHLQDNGPGIEKEAIENIFIPFYTTKSTGSGIGLSLSRQIMRLHNGSLTVHSLPYKSTTFILRF